MADLTDLQSALPVKITGANPSTGIEDNFLEVNTDGSINSRLLDATGTSINLGQTTMTSSLPVTIASNQTAVPTSHSDIAPSNQNITALDVGTSSLVGANGQVFYFGSPTTNSAATFALSSIQTVSLQANLIGAGGTMVVEVSMDGGSFWFRPNVFQISTQNYTNSFTSPFSAIANTSGMTHIRVRATVSWSGTASIIVKESINDHSITIGSSLPTGTNSIGQVTANAGTNLNTSSLSLSATQTNGTQKTQIVDPSNNSITSTLINSKQRLDMVSPSDGADGATAPFFSTQVGGIDGGGNQQAISVDTSGRVNTNLIKTSLTAASPTSATIGTSSATVIASNANRKGLVLTNTSSLAIVSFNSVAGSATNNTGIVLYPHGTWSMDEYTFTTAAINGISTVAATVVAIQEFS